MQSIEDPSVDQQEWQKDEWTSRSTDSEPTENLIGMSEHGRNTEGNAIGPAHLRSTYTRKTIRKTVCKQFSRVSITI